MSRGKPRPPMRRQDLRQPPTDADTSATASADASEEPGSTVKRVRGERVDAPSRELLGHPKTDWGKVGVWVTIGVAIASAIGAAMWNYADTAAAVRNLGEDIRDLKRKTDDLFKASVESSTRLTAIERKSEETRKLPAQETPAITPTSPSRAQ